MHTARRTHHAHRTCYLIGTVLIRVHLVLVQLSQVSTVSFHSAVKAPAPSAKRLVAGQGGDTEVRAGGWQPHPVQAWGAGVLQGAVSEKPLCGSSGRAAHRGGLAGKSSILASCSPAWLTLFTNSKWKNMGLGSQFLTC